LPPSAYLGFNGSKSKKFNERAPCILLAIQKACDSRG
jgi:hypothetical protein